MMSKDQALQISNARLIACVYFGLLAIVATFIIDNLLSLFGVGEFIPTFWAVILATVIAALFGYLFGEKIVHAPKNYLWQSFKWGFLMVLAALPLYDIGFFLLTMYYQPEDFNGATLFVMLVLFGMLLLYSLVLVGIWLAILAGFAAMYLRAKLVYYILETDANEFNNPVTHNQKAPQHPEDDVEI